MQVIQMDGLTRGWLRVAYRIGWDQSEDPNTKLGAILVAPTHPRSWLLGSPTIIGAGANHFPEGMAKRHPERLVAPLKYDYVIHAEQSAIISAAAYTGRAGEATMYCPWSPCLKCAAFIVDAGIKTVIAHKAAHDRAPDRWQKSVDDGIALLEECGVKYCQAEGVVGDCTMLMDGKEWQP